MIKKENKEIKEMEKEIEEVQRFIEQRYDVTALQDLNVAPVGFDANSVQVVAYSNVDGPSLCYQTSNTMDCGAVSSRLSLSYDSFDDLWTMLVAAGFSDVDHDLVTAASDHLRETLKIQSIYDTYIESFGTWERDENGMDARSVVFIPHK